MQDAGIVRNKLKIDGAMLSARSYLDIMEKTDGFSTLLWDHLDGRPKVNMFKTTEIGAGGDAAVARDLEGPRKPRLQVRRPHHRLCLHAGGRHGQRSSGDLPPARGLRETRAQDVTAKRPAANFKTSGNARAWQRMLSGRRLDLLDPSPLDIEIEDIAHGIARVPRWNGQTKGAHIFSVAQHTLAGRYASRASRVRSTTSCGLRSCCTTRRNMWSAT